METTAIVLAAGKGTRMKSAVPKVLHEVCGVPMVEHVRRAVVAAGATRVIVVVSPDTEAPIRECLQASPVEYAIQADPQGTGHAAAQALPLLEGQDGDVLVVCGDTPLISPETLRTLLQVRREADVAVVTATFEPEDPSAYGRVVRQGDDALAIIEHADATEAQRKELTEVNSAVYAFEVEALRDAIPHLKPSPKGEIYLTDTVGWLYNDGRGSKAAGPFAENEFMGVNDRWSLAEAGRIMRLQILERLAREGVTIVDPASTYVEADVTAEPDAMIHPMTVIEGRTTLGAGCQVGPSSWIKDSVIGPRARVFMSHVDQAMIGEGSRCGPFANLRPGTVLETQVKVGNFVEVKNAVLSQQVSVSHLTYIGDASVGPRTNIGAGTITCNYDGFKKSRTTIGADAFVGSNSTLVAPVNIANRAMIAAGSVVTRDVPEGALAVGRGRQENKEEWADRWRRLQQGSGDEAETSTP
ncbi:MAG: bifunctional UDP-N-acetylglucosamine diphosphorylase/glucosamine-1-phosphate N-acetyltransferase GlmU [Armatimonadota bacterium]|jgi:bifunctional UDP-N-acetylglucosamine pyrophosphorylase/glucosamine-1-phosphate N-acetyltransferase|nr:bifunctional UDP-N-acetylglucosamine diphosphorylase/glucosamine-1-phosphate N-acetyltransferase GlmU [Brevundimonas sp.]